MNDDSLVSVVIPVYNVENYLDECMKSVVGQNYKNLEILLVDDASLDKSGEKCDRWAEKDKRVKVLHKVKNEGLNFARRDGVQASTGEWISFVDSDDIVSKSYIRDMFEVARNKTVDIVVCRNQKFVNESEIALQQQLDGVMVLRDKKRIFMHAFVSSPDQGVFMITAWGKLFGRSVVNKIDWDLSNARANEDELESIQFYNIQSRGVAIIKKILYYYRDNPDSIMNKPYANVYSKKRFSRFEWIEELYRATNKYFGKNTLYRDEILYHNVLLNLLFLNRDLNRGVFTDKDAEIFIKNAYPKITKYHKIAARYPLKYEEKRAYDAITNGGLYYFWHDDRKELAEAGKYNAELQQDNTTLQQRNRELSEYIVALQQQVQNLEDSKAYKLGRTIASPYVKVKKMLNHVAK